jgi:hypothetical protein
MSIRLGKGSSEFEFRRVRRILTSSERPGRLWCLHSLLFNGFRGSFVSLKRIGPEVDCICPSSTEVNGDENCTSTFLVFLYDMDRDNFAFIIK